MTPAELEAIAAQSPWEERHCRAALARTYELAAELARRGPSWGRVAGRFVEGAVGVSELESSWCAHLLLFGFEAARVEQELAEVRRLQAQPATDPQGEAVERMVAERDAARAKAAEAYREVSSLQNENQELRRKLSVVTTDVDGVWYWQGDGYDHPGSLSCPVVMSAERLRALVAARPATCPSRWNAYGCALPAGHLGIHRTEGGLTIWPDSADTRVTLETSGDDTRKEAPDAPAGSRPGPQG